MEKLDRLGWAAGMVIRAYGVRVGIRTNYAPVLEHLGTYLPPGWTPTVSSRVDLLYSLYVGGVGSRPGVRRFHLLYGNAGRLVRSLDMDAVFEGLEHSLQLYVAEQARRRVFVHAGVVGWRGRAILLPGRSHAGKSTLVAALIRAGATYYSDEYAVLDAKGRVHPYPRPLSLRHGLGQKPTRYTAEQLGGRTGRALLPIGMVVMTTFKTGAAWRSHTLSPGQATLALLGHTVAARRQPAQALHTLQSVVQHARLLQGPRGEADHLAPVLLGYLEP
jgi:hypothetical protein